jgi:phosphatidylserine/phosphatidylglycerophosphate/cardiolipin synthase-like enzyme
VENMLRDLLAHGIDVRTTKEDLHAKLLVTDKVVVVSSINLNKINLGFNTSKRYWRENTESAFVCKNSEVIKVANKKFLEVLNQSQGVEVRLAGKIEETVRKTFAKTFGLRSSPDARKLIARFILRKQLENRQVLTKIGKITKKLMEHYKRDKVERQDFISAILLYYLSERKRDVANLMEKIREIDPTVNLTEVINGLEFSGFVEKEGDYFKINIAALFS